MRRKTYLKAKNVQTSHDSMKFILHTNAKAWGSLSLPTTLPVILSAVALPVVPKVEFNVVVILYITILVFLSSGTCFKSTIRFQSTQIVYSYSINVVGLKPTRQDRMVVWVFAGICILCTVKTTRFYFCAWSLSLPGVRMFALRSHFP